MKLNYFNFKKFNNQVLMTNDLGKYAFIDSNDLSKVLTGNVDLESPLGKTLLDSMMIYDESNISYSADNKYALREIKGYLNNATSLHIFVVTTLCNMRCVYCQANNGHNDSHLVMSKEIAEKSVDIALQSPEPNLCFEFQGGEPLLNFDIVKHIIEYAEENKGNHEIVYSLVSNLTLITDEILEFLVNHNVGISTSLDGPEDVHNANRPFADGSPTFGEVKKKIEKLQSRGIHVGAIETTTKKSIDNPERIVRTYAELGFDSIFLRPLTPLGKAKLHWDEIGYTSDEFIAFYNRALDEIIRCNLQGTYIKEDHASILIKRIKGESVNYMELRSPCGAGTGQLAYYADGNIFTCDEGRMFSEMGDDTFKLGNVFESSYKDVVGNSVCKTVCSASILETIPSCCDCVYQPYCGTCPVVNYAMEGDLIEKQPRGYKCRIYAGILDAIFSKFQEDERDIISILNSWS